MQTRIMSPRPCHPTRSRLLCCAAVLLAVLAPLCSHPNTAYGQATTRRVLVSDTIIGGIPCAPTGRAAAEWHANGRLLECPLSRDTRFPGQRLPAGTWILLRDTGLLYGAWLPHDARLSGRLCKGTGYKGWSVRFHPNGSLASCYLPRDTIVDGVPCVKGSFRNEIRYRGRTHANFSTDGRLLRCQRPG